VDTAEREPDDVIGLGGTESLTLSQAGELASQHGARVVLVAGEFDSGKTTLVTELWAQFLKGPFEGWHFGGSSTLIAFDRRHQTARASADEDRDPRTSRTSEGDFRLMHMRLARPSGHRQIALLLSDTRGELFEHVINGLPVTEELSAASRADVLLLLIDGNKVGSATERDEAMFNARALLGGLMEDGGFRPGQRIAFILSRADLASTSDRAWWRKAVQELVSLAKERKHRTSLIEVAARPDDNPDDPCGLEAVLNWVTASERPKTHKWTPDWSDARGSWLFKQDTL
jgi:hypothetical protein